MVPVDKLGNMGQEAETQELRVAYDKAIGEDLYEMSREGTTVKFTMNGGEEVKVPVTGIKVMGSTDSTNPGITIDGKAVNATPAPDNPGVWYFTKPGAASGDTRIWTYDAKTVTITGVPEGAVVTLLDYPGDRVDFYDAKNVTAGKLAEDYSYVDSDGKTQTIPKGTVVVMGTYRGDPVYNTVEVQARYDLTGEKVSDKEGAEEKLDERAMNGYALLLAEIPEDGAVSDISDGLFIFVPDWEAEQALNKAGGWTPPPVPSDSGDKPVEADQPVLYPMEIRALLYRTDTPNGNDNPETAQNRRTTSETLWISFPSDLPKIELTSSAN